MMPKAPKAKVGQNKKPVHPNSRKAQQISRKVFRDIRINQGKTARSKLDLLGAKVAWFKENLDQEKTSYTKDDLSELTIRYLHRFDEELEQIDIVSNIGGRQGNQHASRKAAIQLSMDSEKRELESCGIEVPDLVNKANFSLFQSWNGEIKYVQNFKLKKISQMDIDRVQLLADKPSTDNEDADGSDSEIQTD